MNALPAYWPWVLAAVLVLAVVILVLLVLLLRKGVKVTTISDTGEEEDEGLPEQDEAGGGADYARIGSAFRRARHLLTVRGSGNRYRTPLFLLVGAEGSREPGFLKSTAGTGLEHALDDPMERGLAFAAGREFLFFDKAAVLDVAGEPVLGSDGQHADDRAWRAIVRNLVEMRPKRPLDGIILTVGCDELLEAARSEPARLALGERAARVRTRLWDLQEKSGFRLPLYVLVTSCEVLQGFGETTAALRKELRGQMLGWSSPHGAQVPYQSTWVDEAFYDLRQTLSSLQMELFHAGNQGSGVMLFPWSIATLGEPLRAFLNQLLSPGARHEGTLTRGIYFCGNVSSEPRKTTAFVAELFAQKIFPEAGLATPASALRVTRSRRARGMQMATAATFLLCLLGLALLDYKLSVRHDAVLPLLKNSQADMQRMPRMTNKELGTAASELLERMSLVDFDHYSPWWFPASRNLFTGFDEELHQAVGRSFETVILSAIYEKIEERAKREINADSWRIVTETAHGAQEAVPGLLTNDPRSEAPVESPEKLAEFARFKHFVTSLREIEEQGAMFNRVAAHGGGDLTSLSAIVKFAFDRPLPDRFFRHPDMYEHAVRNLSTQYRFNPSLYRRDATTAVKTNAQAVFNQLFDRNPSAWRVQWVAAAINPAEMETRHEIDTERLRSLDRAINLLEKDLSTPTLEWAFRPSFDLGQQFNEVLTSIERSDMFVPATAQEIRREGNERLTRLQQELSATTGLGRPVLKLRADGSGPAMELSNDTTVLHAALQAYLGQSFVVRDSGELRIRISVPDSRLVWDQGQLDQATAVYGAYKDFRQRGLRLFPVNVAGVMDETAQQRTRMQIADILATAQRFESVPPATTTVAHEDDVRAAVLNFDATAKAIRAQLDALQTLRDYNTRHEVVLATSAEAARLLRSVDDLLGSTTYLPRANGFDWWDGEVPPSPIAWGAHDAGELAEYLETTRNRVAALSGNYAAPLLAWFADYGVPSNERDATVLARWQSISDDLHAYAAKKPGNATALLEDYISDRAAKVTPSDCRAAQLKPSEKPGRGYFSEALKHVSEQLSARCATVVSNKAARRYDELAAFFNQRLAGRYPFSDGMDAPKAGEIEADPEDVRRFYRQFDEARPLFAAVSDDVKRSWFAPGANFIDQMGEKKVRAFFAPFLDAKKPMRLPEVNVETAFRILPEKEVGANEIIGWSLTVGNDVATPRDKGKKLQWRPGTPVRLTLRWAADAPRVPVLLAAQRSVSIEDRAIVYQYTNRWALLTALQDLRASTDDLPASELADDGEQQPVTLALSVVTKPALGGEPDARHPSLVFLRMALTGSDGQPLVVPQFPKTAPALRRMTAEAME
jgi:type VI secretion system protein ImpL